ncbi:MAG: hypothetical protein AAGF98_10035 [Cyanobacteria bacterium P01_H01_bin.153]
MPFADEFTDIYQYLIVDALKETPFEVFRGDDVQTQANIISDIVKAISESDLIIADLTSANPNVYYELGLAHAFDKPTILLYQDIDEIPFDLRSYRIITYSSHYSVMNSARSELKDIAEKSLRNELEWGNPVSDFRFHASRSLSVRSSLPKDLLKENSLSFEKDEEVGLLDVQISLEEDLSEITNLITENGQGLTALNSKILETTNSISKNISLKERRDLVRKLANNMQEYSEELRKNNIKYQDLLLRTGNTLEELYGENYEFKESDFERMQTFVDNIKALEEAAYETRGKFLSLIRSMKNLQKFESTFDRSKKSMIQDLDTFVKHLEQNVSIFARAKLAVNTLLSGLKSDQNGSANDNLNSTPSELSNDLSFLKASAIS